MKRTAKIAVVMAALTAAVSACSGESGETTGLPSNTVCGSFAKEPTVAAALEEASGIDTFSDEGSQSEETLSALREADGDLGKDESLLGMPFCKIESPNSKENIFSINFREALTVLGATDKEEQFTFFKTGKSAFSSDSAAFIYFQCRMTDPAKSFIINGSLERESLVDVPKKNLSRDLMILLNAAASKVATELGCKDSGLTTGTPVATSGVYA